MTKTGIRFERRPSPVLPEHRPLYKIGQLLLVLQLASLGGKSSLPRLHLFNWALKSKVRKELLTTAANSKTLSVPAWGFDPMLAIAVRYAIAENLIRETSTGYQITESGQLLVRDIVNDKDLFTMDKAFLLNLGKNINEAMVEDTAKGWGKA